MPLSSSTRGGASSGNLQQLREAFDMPEASLNDIYLALTKEEEL